MVFWCHEYDAGNSCLKEGKSKAFYEAKIENNLSALYYIFCCKILVLSSIRKNYTYSFTRSTYSPVFVFMRITSPSFTNKGTCTAAHVSSVAFFNARVAVSPLRPGSQ